MYINVFSFKSVSSYQTENRDYIKKIVCQFLFIRKQFYFLQPALLIVDLAQPLVYATQMDVMLNMNTTQQHNPAKK